MHPTALLSYMTGACTLALFFKFFWFENKQLSVITRLHCTYRTAVNPQLKLNTPR